MHNDTLQMINFNNILQRKVSVYKFEISLFLVGASKSSHVAATVAHGRAAA